MHLYPQENHSKKVAQTHTGLKIEEMGHGHLCIKIVREKTCIKVFFIFFFIFIFFLQTIKTSQSSNLSLYEINKPINYQYLFYVYLNFIAVPLAVRSQCNTSY